MATTSLSLSPLWEDFIKAKVASGSHASASEVMRDALRALKDQGDRMDALRSHLATGADEAGRGEFVDAFDIGQIIARAEPGA